MPAALDGVRVVQLHQSIAASMCAMFLADFGAEVVKVETLTPGAERSRPGSSVWNRNKRSFIATGPQGAVDLAAMVEAADICITGPGTSFPEHAKRDRLIVLEMPPCSGEAPWAGGAESAELLAAYSGLSLRQYSFEGGPVDSVTPHVLYVQGIWAAACASAALLERDETGQGQLVVVDGMHGALVSAPASFVLDLAEPADEPPTGPGGRNPFYSRYRCSDGRWLFLGALTARFQERAVELLGVEHVASDPRLRGELTNAIGVENRAWVREEFARVFSRRSRAEWVAILESGGCPVGELADQDAWLDHPQMQAIGMRAEVSDVERGPVVMPGVALSMSVTPGTICHGAPRRGEGGPPEWPERSPNPPKGATSGGPLAAYRVIDLGTILAGPLAGSLLADLGADVLKVEPPTGDPFRRFGYVYNRGMRSLAIDLRTEPGRDAFLQIVAGADVVIDNYRQGVLEQFGLRYEDLKAVKPDIITVTIMGFGDAGALAGKLGFDPILQAMSGMMHAQGGNDEPVYLYIPVNDVATAPMTVLGACLALWHRRKSGEGQRCWTSLAGLSGVMQSDELVRYEGRPAPRRGGRDFKGPGPLDRYYRCSDGWIRLQTTGDGDLLWSALGIEHHPADDDETVERLGGALAAMTSSAALKMLHAMGLPAARARTRDDLAGDDLLLSAGALSVHQREGLPPYLLPDRYARFERSERTQPLVSPGLGEHSRAILSESGLTQEAIEALISDGTVVEGEPTTYIAGNTYK